MKRRPPKQPSRERCGAKTRKGTPCDHEPGWGTQHPGAGKCRLHGGAEAHAQVNGLVQLARREMAVMGQPLSIEPQEAILECIRIAAGEVSYASERISELDLEDAVGPVTTHSLRRTVADPAALDGEIDKESKSELVADTRAGPPALHIWIQVRQRAMDRLVQYSFWALKAGIEERRVRIAEQQGMLLAQAIQGILRELGVDQKPEVPSIVRKHLTLVAGQSVA
ncbi:MAG TPA: hypothetical protein VG275_06870 [Solirubrobacteraceae bacterium]|jgi:hypothetical protein|nr:hypothetical protein [Solirubrobacteraceae bacterium]